MAVRLAITAMLIITATVAAQEPEGAWGIYVGRPVGSVSVATGWTGMQGAECPGYAIASGIVSQADHEAAEGFANIGNDFGLSMRPASPLYQRVLDLRGKPVEVVLRPLPERTLERIK